MYLVIYVDVCGVIEGKQNLRGLCVGRGGEGARKTDGDRIGRHDWIG